MTTELPLVVAEDLQLEYSGALTALDGISLEIAAGQFVAIVGPSGCGKSTLLRLLGGLLKPTGGRLELAGQPPESARQGEVPTSFVFQDATLLPWRTVRENIELPQELLGEAAGNWLPIDEALNLVGLADFADRYPSQLSGGMRMRASLARALVTAPRLLLLDEPFAALDDITRGQLNDDLLQLWQQRGWTSVFVTHNISEAVYLSQRVVVMSPRPGRVAADIAINFAGQRSAALRSSPEFARQCGEVSEALRRACG